MNKGTAIDLGLNEAYNDLFSTQEDRDNAQRSYVTDLPPEKISDFPNHPFKVRMDQSMIELSDSVKQYGVLVPSLVRPMLDGSYQMVSGHRRKRAAELAGLPTVPCIIRELTDDEAIIVMVDSNLQREQILPSEKAVAYKMKLEAMKRQGMRTDLTFGPLGQKSAINTRDILATEVPDSSRQIQRYIRLTNLIPELLDMVDNSVLKEAGKLQMALRPAVERPESNDLTAWITALAHARTQSKALCCGSYRNVLVQPKQLIFERYADGERVLVAINADGNPFTAHFDAGCGMAVDMITGAPHDFGGGSELAPYSVSYWKMER